MAKVSKYKLKDSDRSGFTFKEIVLTKDNGQSVGPDEVDMPPPSNKSTGGEGVVLNPDMRQNSDSYAAINSRLTQVISAAGGITFVDNYDSQNKFDTNNQWIYIAGASSLTNVTANPQISAGYHQALFTVQAVSNTILLENSNGLVLRRNYNMSSGAILNLIYNATDNLWHEVSRSNINGGIE